VDSSLSRVVAMTLVASVRVVLVVINKASVNVRGLGKVEGRNKCEGARGCTNWSSRKAANCRSGSAGEDTGVRIEVGRASTRLGEARGSANRSVNEARCTSEGTGEALD
jgi:hypothetical protein